MTNGAAARRMGGAEWGMLALLSMVWGGSFFFYKVLVRPSALRGGGDLPSELACLMASLSYAFGSFYARRFSWMGPLKLAAGQTTAAALIMLPLAAVADRFWTLSPPDPSTWAALL